MPPCVVPWPAGAGAPRARERPAGPGGPERPEPHMGGAASRSRHGRHGRHAGHDQHDLAHGLQGRLATRRTQSSGSLQADRLDAAAGARACGKHGRRAAYSGSAREARYKLCGSLPNDLDTSPAYQCDIDHVTLPSPASPAWTPCAGTPAAYHKARVLSVRSLGSGSGAGEFDGLDLGYASERSPDDDKMMFPVAAQPGASGACWRRGTQSVVLERGPRGLGLSVCGGADCPDPDGSRGLVRVKRVFPHQPAWYAWQSGLLHPGDILLAVNGQPLGGLTNHEALEVLRTAPNRVVLTVAPGHGQLGQHPLGEPETPDASGASGQTLSPGPGAGEPDSPTLASMPPHPMLLLRQDSCGEFEVSLSKVHGSLGFTLRKEDSSALGHYVLALVREPALSDGRVRPGDKIVSVNGVDISIMSHAEAVAFLRNAGDTVNLRLYRDVVQTPVSALSPSETHKAFRPKPLRKEALDMLNDLAERKMMPAGNSATLGRLRRVSDGRTSQRGRTQSFGAPQTKEQPSHLCHRNQPSQQPVEIGDQTYSNTSTSMSSICSSTSCTGSVVERPRRPESLDLNGEPRPRWKLKRLTSPEDDASDPDGDHSWSAQEDHINNVDDENCANFGSLPCEARSPPIVGNFNSFHCRNPPNHAAHPSCGAAWSKGPFPQDQDSVDSATDPEDGCRGLLKWKGVVFTRDEDTSSARQISQDDSHGQVLTVELTRGWNARLGFSLQPDRQHNGHSVISAIYTDSVAAKDGRLRVGDRVIMINDESVEGLETCEVIDIFRKIRGAIAITVWRRLES